MKLTALVQLDSIVDRLLCAPFSHEECIDIAKNLIRAASSSVTIHDVDAKIDKWMASIQYTNYIMCNQKKVFFKISKTYNGLNQNTGFVLFMTTGFSNQKLQQSIEFNHDIKTKTSLVRNLLARFGL